MLYIGILIFIVVFYCIITEKVPSSWATMGGGLLMTLIGITSQDLLGSFYLIFILKSGM